MNTLKLFFKNLLSTVIDTSLFLSIIVFYAFLPYVEVNIFGWKSNVYSNLGFFLIFLVFSIIPYYFLSNITLGEKVSCIYKEKFNKKDLEKNKFFLLIELLLINLFDNFKRLLLINVYIYIMKNYIFKKKYQNKEKDIEKK